MSDEAPLPSAISPSMDSLFVSYRREDTQGWAGRIVADLRRRFPRVRIFFDLHSMQGGEDFPRAIDDALASCTKVLVLIGPGWRGAPRQNGFARIFDENDWVRAETAAALRHANALVIPVLLGGARMPMAEELPPDLTPITRLHALEMTDERWDFDLQRLVDRLAMLQSSGRLRRGSVGLAAALTAAALLAAGAWWASTRAPETESASATTVTTSPAIVLTPAPRDPLITTASAPFAPRPTVLGQSNTINAASSPAIASTPVPRAPVAAAASGSYPPRPTVPSKRQPTTAASSPARATVAGRWVTEEFKPLGPTYYDRVQEFYELEARGDDIVGNRAMMSWTRTDSAPEQSEPQPISEGRFVNGRLKFCIGFRVLDEGKYHPYKYCYDGLVDGDHMDLLLVTNIGHPFGPERSQRFQAHRSK